MAEKGKPWPTVYRLNGSEAMTLEEFPWDILSPFDIVEAKSPGVPWYETIPARPVIASHGRIPESDGRYRLEGPIWPPATPF